MKNPKEVLWGVCFVLGGLVFLAFARDAGPLWHFLFLGGFAMVVGGIFRTVRGIYA